MSTTVTSPLADQTTSRIVAELGKNVIEKRLNCYREDVKRNRGKAGVTDSKFLLH